MSSPIRAKAKPRPAAKTRSPAKPASTAKAKPGAKPARKAGTKRARTREKLLDAAAELFRTKGISAVSLDEVAAHASLTKGAIYGNFENKDDLVFAVAMERITRPRPIFVPGIPLKVQLADMVTEAFSRTPAARKEFAFLIELDLHTVTHEGFSRRMLNTARERYQRSAENLAAITKPGQLPMPPVQMAIIVHALFNGLIFQRAFFPDLISNETVIKALEALID